MAKRNWKTEDVAQLGAEREIARVRTAQSFEQATITVADPLAINLDTRAGGTFRSKPILDLDGVKAKIDSGEQLALGGKTVITYTFNNLDHLVGLYNNPTIGFGAPFGFSAFSAAQQAEARDSIRLWDDLVAPTFKETKGLGADIQFANSYDPAQAYAYYPGKPNYLFRSDVFVATPEVNWTNNWLGFNGYGATTLIHELGHSLGLSHPGAYNFGPGFSVNYTNGAEYAQDSLQYSIMSYWRGSETNAIINDYSTFFAGNAQTPLLHDILTIQAKYGADPTTRVGDTVYGFGSTAGNPVYDFSKNLFPHLSIYDAGGNDTIDLSGFGAGVFLNLHAGSFSSAAAAIPDLATINANRAAITELASIENPDLTGLPNFVAAPITEAMRTATITNVGNATASRILAETGVADVRSTSYDNISIAYGTTIENGIGGSQRDLIWGNEVANRLEGRGGNDVLRGFEGNDTLLGGDGNDVLRGDEGADILTGGAGNDTFDFRAFEKGDRITDFASGADKIDLTGIRNADNTGSFDFTWIGGSAFSGVAGQLRYSNGVLEADQNGDGLADLQIFLTNQPHIVQTDVLFG